MDPIHLLQIINVILSALLVSTLVALIIVIRNSKKQEYTEEELSNIVDESHESGVLLASEAEMIQNIFEFDEKDVKDIMVHRKNIVAMDCEMTFREALAFVNEYHYSRYPVFEEDLDHIIGLFHIKDMLEIVDKLEIYENKIKDLPGLIGPAEFFPETHGINTLFAKMQQSKTHMVLVVDEYGQISGLLSMEDILEEIVGSIEDEHDEDEEDIEQITEDIFTMDGSTSINRFEEVFGVRLTEDFETLNGFLTAEIGKIPEDGTFFDVTTQGFVFHVLNVENKVIGDISVEKLPESTEEIAE